MPKEKKFYVYVHRYASGHKQGQVFYVGKGKDKRLKSKMDRSKWWKNVVKKYGFIYEIVIRFKSEACAFSFEKALIRNYGRENLVNLTDGGEGMSGWVPNNNTRETWSKIRTGKKLSKQHRESISKGGTGRIASEETRAKLSMAKSGENHHFWGFSGEMSPTFKPEKIRFVHDGGIEVLMNRQEMINSFGLNKSRLSSVILGRTKSHKGWRLA